MIIKQALIQLGVQSDNIDTHYSDLYVLRSPRVLEFLDSNNINYKPFICQRTKEIWLEIPFGNMYDYLNSKNKLNINKEE